MPEGKNSSLAKLLSCKNDFCFNFKIKKKKMVMDIAINLLRNDI